MLRSLAIRVLPVFVVAVFMYANVANAQLVTDGLVAYWPLDADTIDGDAVEDVWGDNEGTINGDPQMVAGKIGNALEFDGDDFVDIPGTESLNFNGKSEMTVVAWVKSGADEPVIGVVALPGGCCGTIVAQRDMNGWALRYDGRNPDQEMEFIVCPGWTGDGGFGAPVFGVGEWHHLAAVVDDTDLLLYADGELLNTIPFAGPMSSDGSETEIGYASDGGFVGLIDEVLIYEKALNEAEIRQNYGAGGLTAVNPNSKLAICWGEIRK